MSLALRGSVRPLDVLLAGLGQLHRVHLLTLFTQCTLAAQPERDQGACRLSL
jgi:hypothetical protein